MSLSTSAPAPRPDVDPQRPPRRRLRRAVAVVAAGGLLTGVVGLSGAATSASTAATTTLSARGWGYGGGGQSYDPWGQSGSAGSSGSTGAQTSTVDSQAATATEEKGVALIDTVLSNGEAAGTGIVLTSDGEVLTNYHVVEGSTSIKVTIASTGKTYTATVVGDDPTADVALLQLKDASGLTVAKIDDDTLKAGDAVTAVGNAGGTGTLSAAAGTVTSLSATITTESEDAVKGETLKALIETSADVVPGDSGGPLVDAEGEVVGIDTAASSGQQIDGYAIPIATALTIVVQIRNGAETSAVRIGPAAFLGVQLSSGNDTFISGATVAGVVEGDAAAAAGLAAGDTITKIGSTTISSADDLSSTLAKHQPGDKVSVTWVDTDSQTHNATVTLGSSPIN